MKALTPEISKDLKSFCVGKEKALEELHLLDEFVKEKRSHFMGYPCNTALHLQDFIQWWGQSSISETPLNEVGDPYQHTHYTLNARPFEQEALSFFSRLYSISDPWGYITSGGTQGNEQGLYIGRTFLSKKGTPVLYVSEEAHYSIASLAKVLNLECCLIATQSTGEMDYQDLALKLQTDRPALFSLSIGTTFKGGIDDIEKVQQIVKERGIQDVYYHADAALFGGYLPFLLDEHKPDLSFEKHPYHSIAVSGHKFFGSPVPFGIFLTRHPFVEGLEGEYIEYVHTRNVTIPCSRSALNSLTLWWTVATTPIEEFQRQANEILENAHYLEQQLRKRHYPVWLNPYSNTVYLKAPSFEFCKRWSLALMTCRQLGPLAHIVVMQHVDKSLIDQFLNELDHTTEKAAA